MARKKGLFSAFRKWSRGPSLQTKELKAYRAFKRNKPKKRTIRIGPFKF